MEAPSLDTTRVARREVSVQVLQVRPSVNSQVLAVQPVRESLPSEMRRGVVSLGLAHVGHEAAVTGVAVRHKPRHDGRQRENSRADRRRSDDEVSTLHRF